MSTLTNASEAHHELAVVSNMTSPTPVIANKMSPKTLPSSCGLPNCWDKEIELRLGYLEAEDQHRDPKDLVKALKREFPDLANYVISPDSLQRWIQWLDQQGSPRGDFYRVGVAAGHAMAKGNLNAMGVELDLVNLNNHKKTDLGTAAGTQASAGVRLVDSGNGIDEGVRVAAGGLESMIDGNNSSNSSNMSPIMVYHTARRSRTNDAVPTTPTPAGAGALSSHTRRSSSQAHRRNAITDEDIQRIRYLGTSTNRNRSISPMAQPMSASTASGSLNVPTTGTSSSYPSTPISPATVTHPTRTMTNTNNQTPATTNSNNMHTPTPFHPSPSSGSGGIGLSSNIPANSNATTPNTGPQNLSPSRSSLRERRRLGEMNISITNPKRGIDPLPETDSKENEQQQLSTPSGASTSNKGLKGRMMSRLGRK